MVRNIICQKWSSCCANFWENGLPILGTRFKSSTTSASLSSPLSVKESCPVFTTPSSSQLCEYLSTNRLFLELKPDLCLWYCEYVSAYDFEEITSINDASNLKTDVSSYTWPAFFAEFLKVSSITCSARGTSNPLRRDHYIERPKCLVE